MKIYISYSLFSLKDLGWILDNDNTYIIVLTLQRKVKKTKYYPKLCKHSVYKNVGIFTNACFDS